jgi:hypothetical protein
MSVYILERFSAQDLVVVPIAANWFAQHSGISDWQRLLAIIIQRSMRLVLLVLLSGLVATSADVAPQQQVGMMASDAVSSELGQRVQQLLASPSLALESPEHRLSSSSAPSSEPPLSTWSCSRRPVKSVDESEALRSMETSLRPELALASGSIDTSSSLLVAAG